MLAHVTLHTLLRDDHGLISLSTIDLGKVVASKVSERYEARTGRRKKVSGVQLGCESRCAPPLRRDARQPAGHRCVSRLGGRRTSTATW
ncbi:MAG: hypothetical protein IPN77_22405 [Sandaracinaceae bacterium]|nr:hypothetical protein [Sandaracinaceae bacterium]